MQLNSKETYLSVDVEATGPVPGLFSMIDIGIAQVGQIDNTFSASLLELPNAGWSPGASSFWHRNDHNRRVLTEIQERAQPVQDVMYELNRWLKQFNRPVFVGFPVAFDFAFVHWYWWYVIKQEPPFSHSGLDGKTLAMLLLKSGYREAGKRLLKKAIPKRSDLPHTHFGLDDAREQAVLFEQIMERL